MNIYDNLHDLFLNALAGYSEEELAKVMTDAFNDAKGMKAEKERDSVAEWYNAALEHLEIVLCDNDDDMLFLDAALWAAMAASDRHPHWSVDTLKNFIDDAQDALEKLDESYAGCGSAAGKAKEKKKPTAKVKMAVFENGKKVEEKEIDPYEVLRQWVEEINRT